MGTSNIQAICIVISSVLAFVVPIILAPMLCDIYKAIKEIRILLNVHQHDMDSITRDAESAHLKCETDVQALSERLDEYIRKSTDSKSTEAKKSLYEPSNIVIYTRDVESIYSNISIPYNQHNNWTATQIREALLKDIANQIEPYVDIRSDVNVQGYSADYHARLVVANKEMEC